MINNNVTLDVNKLFIYSRNFLHNITLCFFFLCLKLFLFFFVFEKLALGLNNVCKVRCTNKQKRKRPLFVSTKKSP